MVCNDVLEHTKSAEEVQTELKKPELQFSAQSVKLKYILFLVSTFFTVIVLYFFPVTSQEELRSIYSEPLVGQGKKDGIYPFGSTWPDF